MLAVFALPFLVGIGVAILTLNKTKRLKWALVLWSVVVLSPIAAFVYQDVDTFVIHHPGVQEFSMTALAVPFALLLWAVGFFWLNSIWKKQQLKIGSAS